jgi:hypothetical protein
MNEMKNVKRGIIRMVGVALVAIGLSAGASSVYAQTKGQIEANAHANAAAVNAGANLGAGVAAAPLPEPATWLGLTSLAAAATVYARKRRRQAT